MGKIFTFYSFKGGVGRTMALANVGLLAAMNGKRVLLMDWDLEAPGLAYYFRGLLGRQDEISLRDSPGILNLLVEWREAIKPSISAHDLDLIKDTYKQGAPFERCVRTLVEPAIADGLIRDSGCLHFISAGSSQIQEIDASYEQALSDLSWADFFSQKVGGYFLERLQEWAKAKYDFILIDSRTGLADAAGICTMLLPDEVALCFALNHQNIEGVSRVAKSIGLNASDSIKVRSIPMRVARRDSSESSDAQARAIAALTQTGGLKADDVKFDLQNLAIAFDDSLPFYETLAIFTAQGTDPTFDPLTLSYLRLTKALLGLDVSLPELSTEVIRRVKERLSPRNATTQYLIDLRLAEPSRGYSEILRLVQIAQDTVLENRPLERDYVQALVDGVLDLINKIDEVEEAFSLLSQVLKLVQLLTEQNSLEWRSFYVDVIQNSLFDITMYGREEDEFYLRIELERQLIESGGLRNEIMRLSNLQELARIEFGNKNYVEVAKYLEAMAEILDKVNECSDLEQEQMHSLLMAMINMSILSSDLAVSKGDYLEARKRLEQGLDNIYSFPRRASEDMGDEFTGVKFKLHFQLAMLQEVPDDVKGEHCVLAAETGAQEFIFRFVELAKISMSIIDSLGYGIAFCEKAMMPSRRRRLMSYYVRTPHRAGDYLEVLRDMVKIFGAQERQSLVLLIATAFVETLQAIEKQRYSTGQSMRRVTRIAEEFIGRLHNFEFSDESILEPMEKVLNSLKSRKLEG